MTRTLLMGNPGPVLKDAVYAVYEAVKAAEKAVREGAPAADVDKAARDVLGEYGFANYFIHSTGHGVGVEVHEPPRLYATSKEVLKRGQVITIEPGVYIDGVGGVRIEDMASSSSYFHTSTSPPYFSGLLITSGVFLSSRKAAILRSSSTGLYSTSRGGQ